MFFFSIGYFTKSDHALDPMELMTPITELAWAFALIACFCEFSHIMSEEFNRFNDELNKSEWYLIPIEMQRIYLIFLLDTQQLTVVCGFGNIFCTRDTFKSVNQFISLKHQIEISKSYVMFFLVDNENWIFLLYDAPID